MAYIGNQLAQSYISLAKQDFTTSATTAYTLDYPVANENEIALFINFVRQEPTTAYTASGTSLTLSSATSASDDMYAIFIGKAVQTVTPASGSITNAMLSSGSFTNITNVGTLASGLTLSDNILFNAASKGIYLGVTSATASNLLDDYEEGTWTPTMTASVSGAISLTNSAGIYTKIGNLVYLWGIIDADLTSKSGSYTFGGVPFSSEDVGDHNNRYSGVTSYQENTGVTTPLLIQLSSSTDIAIYKDTSGNAFTSSDTTSASFAIRFALAYRTAS